MLALRKDRTPTVTVFRNVRCVPDFDYTLLSVKQIWREQRVNSLFADDECLVMENGDRLPFDSAVELPTVRMVSLPKLLSVTAKRGGAALPAVATPATAMRPPPTPSTSPSTCLRSERERKSRESAKAAARSSDAGARCGQAVGRDACVRRRAAASHGLPTTTVEEEGRDEARGGARGESRGRGGCNR